MIVYVVSSLGDVTLAEVQILPEVGVEPPRETWEMLMAQLQNHQTDMLSNAMRKGKGPPTEGEGMTPFSPTQAVAAKTGISRSQFSLPYDSEVW